jgi:hypothetical protein
MKQQDATNVVNHLIHRCRISAYPAPATQLDDLLQSIEVLENGDIVLNLEVLAMRLHCGEITASTGRIHLRTGKR